MSTSARIRTVPVALATLVVGMLFAAAGSYLFAAWSAPTDAPPGGNVDAPINVGTSPQYKAAVLGALGGSFGSSGLTVGTSLLSNGSFLPGGAKLLLDVEGAMGATEYCDQNGLNCKKTSELVAAPPTCGGNNILQWNGTSWACVPAPVGALASAGTIQLGMCPSTPFGERFLKGFNPDGSKICSPVMPIPPKCVGSKMLQWSAPSWSCVDVPTGSGGGSTGGGSAIPTPPTCTGSKMLQWTGSSWNCKAGASSQMCPSGQVVRGINADGTLNCVAQTTGGGGGGSVSCPCGTCGTVTATGCLPNSCQPQATQQCTLSGWVTIIPCDNSCGGS